MKTKALKASAKAKLMPPDPDAAAKLVQLKFYEEALKYFQQQKFHRAKQSLERALEGPSRELARPRSESTFAFATSAFRVCLRKRRNPRKITTRRALRS